MACLVGRQLWMNLEYFCKKTHENQWIFLHNSNVVLAMSSSWNMGVRRRHSLINNHSIKDKKECRVLRILVRNQFSSSTCTIQWFIFLYETIFKQVYSAAMQWYVKCRRFLMSRCLKLYLSGELYESTH